MELSATRNPFLNRQQHRISATLSPPFDATLFPLDGAIHYLFGESWRKLGFFLSTVVHVQLFEMIRVMLFIVNNAGFDPLTVFSITSVLFVASHTMLSLIWTQHFDRTGKQP